MSKNKKQPRSKKSKKGIPRKQISDAWDSSLEVTLLDGKTIPAISIDKSKRTACLCPFHDDACPSAFVGYSEKSLNYFITCSSEHSTYWKAKDANRYAVVTKDYWSYGTDYFEFGFANEKFFYQKIGITKIQILANASIADDRNELTAHIVKNKHIPHIGSIDYLGDHTAASPYYSIDQVKGVVSVYHPMIPASIADNIFIEDYLSTVFGQYKDFIKQWIAVYTYTNYRKLPTLIFTGPRGSGKSTFAELLMEIYKPLSTDWEGVSKSFDYEFENKLLVVEENDRDTTDQYKIFKTITGQREKTVNKKFKDPYRIKNNANLILLSNEPIPMYVKKEELPADPKNNQFFVYEFSPLNTPIDAQLFQKLVDRLGHYCRTELATVFSQLYLDDKRYSIEVPITDAEKALFDSNVTEIDSEVNDIIEYLNRNMTASDTSGFQFRTFIEAGFLPSKIIKHSTAGKSHIQSKIKNLTKRGFIEPAPSKKMIDNVRENGYTMTQKMMDAIYSTDAEELKPNIEDDNAYDNNAACPVAV
jgi:energy-coupling factor transporter ATP-binding protein EcfA2